MAQRGATRSVTLTAAGAGTTNGTALSLDVDGGTNVGVVVNNTNVSGTPTLDVKLQWSADGIAFGDAETADSFTQVTTTKVVAKVFGAKAPFVRAVATVAGTTPSVTVAVDLYPIR